MSKRIYTEDDYLKVMAMADQGMKNTEITELTGVSVRTIIRMRNGQWEPPSGPSMPLLGRSPLTDVITGHIDGGYCLADLTVLARGNDPGHCGRSQERGWLCGTLESPGVQISEGGQTIRNRGLHYLQRRDPAPGREADHGLPRGRGDGGGLVPAAAGRAG